MDNPKNDFAILTALTVGAIIVLSLGGVLGLYALLPLLVPSSSQPTTQQQTGPSPDARKWAQSPASSSQPTAQQPTAQWRWCKDTPRFDGFVAVETCTFQGSWRTPAQLWFDTEGFTVRRTSLWGTMTERWVPYREVHGVTIEHRGAHDVLIIDTGRSMGESFYFPQGGMGTDIRDAVIRRLGRRGN